MYDNYDIFIIYIILNSFYSQYEYLYHTFRQISLCHNRSDNFRSRGDIVLCFYSFHKSADNLDRTFGINILKHKYVHMHMYSVVLSVVVRLASFVNI